ncbi:uncharacterized protein TEOVI_000881200 [Trypanosoma equiperdum]|uniref:T. brucei spp.-specific protein n=2 Tax=Trypanozoon TaxID=39700 RepID=Q38AW3_TRYB2|nr:hypothetical protein Tb10.70.0380 [Trypanosoma brucei brucei TREU927]EAN78057.1 hypothetical protein Tb10.70.0380 [Trypanosoma brucei brucei TREU927]SCU73210.1 hypothetical protein, conserved [Trypanosoma equiperdum]
MFLTRQHLERVTLLPELMARAWPHFTRSHMPSMFHIFSAYRRTTKSLPLREGTSLSRSKGLEVGAVSAYLCSCRVGSRNCSVIAIFPWGNLTGVRVILRDPARWVLAWTNSRESTLETPISGDRF